MDGSGKLHRRIGDQRRLVVQRVARQRVLQFRDAADIARVQFGDRADSVLPNSVPMCDSRSADAGARVHQVGVVLHHAGDHFEIRHAPRKRIGDGFEDERGNAARNPSPGARLRAPLSVPFHGPRSAGAGKYSSTKFRIRSLADVVQRRKRTAPGRCASGARRRAGRRGCAPPAACPCRKILRAARRCPRPPFRPALRARSCAASARSAGISPSLPLPSPSRRVGVRFHAHQIDHAFEVALRSRCGR